MPDKIEDAEIEVDAEGPLSPEEIEKKKLFDEFASKHREGAAKTAAADTSDADDEDEEENDADDAEGDAADKAAETEGTGEKIPDIWANATPEQKAAFSAAKATQDAHEQYKRSNEGRIAGFQRQIDTLNTALAGRADASTKAEATAADKKVADATASLTKLLENPKLVAARKEFPEIYEPLLETMGGLIAESANLKAQVGKLETTTLTRFERDTLADESRKIMEMDPDYVSTVNKPEFAPAFGKWLAEQPAQVQAMVKSAATDGVKNASDTSWAFRAFKRDTGFGGGQQAALAKAEGKTSTSSATEKTRRNLQLDTNTSVQSRRPSVTPNNKDGSGDTVDADWKRNVDRIKRRQQQEGVSY